MSLIPEDYNLIGERGESIFFTSITRHIPRVGRLFDPSFLGAKFPDVDYYVALRNYPVKKAFFFASIKTTTKGLNADKTKLNIYVSNEKMVELVKFQIPTYLFGIDEIQETVYFLNVNTLEKNASLNGIPVKYPLNHQNLLSIWEEVAAYYNSVTEITKFTSIFK